jgi:hypothetical protein
MGNVTNSTPLLKFGLTKVKTSLKVIKCLIFKFGITKPHIKPNFPQILVVKYLSFKVGLMKPHTVPNMSQM